MQCHFADRSLANINTYIKISRCRTVIKSMGARYVECRHFGPPGDLWSKTHDLDYCNKIIPE